MRLGPLGRDPGPLYRAFPDPARHVRRLAESDAWLQAGRELEAWLQAQPSPFEVFLAIMRSRPLPVPRPARGSMSALQRMTNVSYDRPDRNWIVEVGEVVAPDHPAVALHPLMFEEIR